MRLFLSLAKQPDEIDLAKRGLAEIDRSSASTQPPAVDQGK